MVTMGELFSELGKCHDEARIKEIKTIMHQFLVSKGYQPSKTDLNWYSKAEHDRMGLGFGNKGALVVTDTDIFSTYQLSRYKGHKASQPPSKVDTKLEKMVQQEIIQGTAPTESNL